MNLKKMTEYKFDPMLIDLDELEKYAEIDEFLRGVYYSRVSLIAAGVLKKDKDGTEHVTH